MPIDTRTQQKEILRALKQRPHNTIELRSYDILSPNPRILELRKMGFWIITQWQQVVDSQGDIHRVGQYVYLPGYNNLTKRGEDFLNSL